MKVITGASNGIWNACWNNFFDINNINKIEQRRMSFFYELDVKNQWSVALRKKQGRNQMRLTRLFNLVFVATIDKFQFYLRN